MTLLVAWLLLTAGFLVGYVVGARLARSGGQDQRRRCRVCARALDARCHRCEGPACSACDRCQGCLALICERCDTEPTPPFRLPGDTAAHPHTEERR